jgi:arylsulfatase A-like enzyme
VGGDGIEAARTSVYGYERPTTPFLERFAERGLLFENAFPNVNTSAGSLASLLTGKSPLETKLILHPEILTGLDSYQHLPGILRHLGYRSIHMSTRLYTDPFEQNMQDSFDVANFRARGATPMLPALPGRLALAYAPALHFVGELSGRVVERVLHAAGVRTMTNPLKELKTAGWVSDPDRIRAVLDFIDGARGPVFAHLHLMGTHVPLVPRRPLYSAGALPSEQWARRKDLYDDCISDFDRDVEHIVTHLERAGKLGNTVVVITSDHGWSWSYARLPLLVRFPGDEPRGRRAANAQLIDIAPTLLDYLRVPVPAWMDGTSLLPALDPMRPIVSVRYRKRNEGPFGRVGSVGVTLCDRVFWLNPHDDSFASVPVAGYVGPCGTGPDAVGRTRLVDELRLTGFDVSSLAANGPPP